MKGQVKRRESGSPGTQGPRRTRVCTRSFPRTPIGTAHTLPGAPANQGLLRARARVCTRLPERQEMPRLRARARKPQSLRKRGPRPLQGLPASLTQTYLHPWQNKTKCLFPFRLLKSGRPRLDPLRPRSAVGSVRASVGSASSSGPSPTVARPHSGSRCRVRLTCPGADLGVGAAPRGPESPRGRSHATRPLRGGSLASAGLKGQRRLDSHSSPQTPVRAAGRSEEAGALGVFARRRRKGSPGPANVHVSRPSEGRPRPQLCGAGGGGGGAQSQPYPPTSKAL